MLADADPETGNLDPDDVRKRITDATRQAAQEAIRRRPRPYEMNLIKTYYESTLKEHMYVTGDADRAREAGESLIALDPAWAPSYAELAEVYEEAAALGPPYVGHHLLSAARCREELGEAERAVDHYVTLSGLAPRNESLLTAGLRVAEKVSRQARDHFEFLLAQTGSRPATSLANERR